MPALLVRKRDLDVIERAYALLTIKEADGEARIIRGVATTPEPDRYGDIVDPMGVTFKNPIPLLHQHDSRRPVGTVKLGKPTEEGITFEAKLPKIPEDAAPSLKDRVDTAWGEIKSGLVRAVSIGFRPLEYSYMDNGGVRFVASEILELSLVSIPANADAAITDIKAFDRRQRAALGEKKQATVVKIHPPGATGQPIRAKEARTPVKKSIAEQISAFEATRQQKTLRMDAIMDESAEKGETLNAEQKDEYDTLDAEVKAIDDHLLRLRAREKTALTTATEVKGQTVLEAARGTATVQVRSQKLAPGVGFIRLLTARYAAMKDNCSPADIAISRGWGEEFVSILRVPKSVIQRAAIAPATTTDPTWAAPLVIAQNLTGEFIELVRAAEILSRIPGLRRMPFNVKVPRQTGTTTAYWVAEGAPKPVSKAAFDSISLGFNKVAGITLMTDELMRFSTPAAEGLLVDDLKAAIIKLVDHDFLDPAKAAVAGTSPASITNGVAAIPATGTTADAFRTDFNTAMATFTAAGLGVRSLSMVMRETQALALGLMRNSLTGNVEFPNVNANGGNIQGVNVVASENVVAGTITFISAPNILVADEGGVEVDVSTEASLQANDAPDNPATGNTTIISLWQQNLVGIRCERYVTWSKPTAGSVAYISGANYH